MHILFAGGGTAGHINPALAIAGEIKKNIPDAKISYIGTAKKLEATLVPAAGYDFYSLDVAGFRRSLSPKAIAHNVKAVYLAAAATLTAQRLIKKLKPDLVIGTGGYVSGPVLKAAQRLGIKTALHEQNAYPGVTTKMLAAKADLIMLAFSAAEKFFDDKKKLRVTGNPVRRELLEISRAAARKKLGLDNRPLILSFGGSLGARPINEAVEALIRHHNGSGKYYHIHATGKAGYDMMLSHLSDITLSSEITVKEYIYDMDICLAAADMVICRAGAITLSEISALSKPAILIPSPYVAENHQYHNAMVLKNAGAAELIEQKDLSGEGLIAAIEELLGDGQRLAVMSKNAKKSAILNSGELIFGEITELLNNRQ